MRQHIENLKQKPEHVRHRVALGVSVGATALVAIIWFIASAATGTFALSTPSLNPPDDSAPSEFAEAKDGFSQIAGAIGSTFDPSSNDPELTIVDGRTTSTLDSAPPENQNQTNAKAISF